jgi:methionyl-tRNA formyltransferase
MKKVLFLGSKNIGLECLKTLHKKRRHYNYEITGALTNKRGKKIIDFCNTNNIRLIENLNDILNDTKFDIGISVQYHKILKIKHIKRAKEIMLNLHMAPLPEYRGCNQFSYAIIDKLNFFGSTIHEINEEYMGR